MRTQVGIDVPDIKVLDVGGITDTTYDPNNPADGEYALDIQVPYPVASTQGCAL